MNRMLTFLISALMVTAAFAQDYRPGADFKIANKLMFHGDPNFSDLGFLGAQSVMSGMDFDGDMKSEILFTMDETLVPNGPDPGRVGIYLYESDGIGGYNHVWHFVSPDSGNSLPGMFHGDIDGDGNHEIYFGVPPAAGHNDATWGTYIFEQGTDGTFPATATHLLHYGMTVADNFRPAGYAMADLDGDGKTELATVDRGGRRLSIDALAGNSLDDLASFTNEYLNVDNLGGGGVYDVDIADTDMDGRPEVWVNTWDRFSFAIFEATDADTYVLAADLNALFDDFDPGSFNSNGFAFNDVDRDDDMDAWFPMTNGKLYYFDNPALDSIAPNTLTQGNVDGGTSDWVLSTGVAVATTGDTLYYQTMIDTLTAVDGITDSLVYDTSLVAFAASDLDKGLQISGGSAHISVAAPDAGSQFYASVHVMPGHPGYTVADGGNAIFFVNFKDSSGDIVPAMHNADTLAVSSTAGTANAWNTWKALSLFLNVPAGAATVEIGVKHMHATTTATDLADGAIFVDAMEMEPVVGNGVADINNDSFLEVLTFGADGCRGADMGDIDGDNKPDIIVGTGTKETVVRIEFVGSDPTDPADYTMETILSSKGAALDRYYPLAVDGKQVVIPNLYANEASQAQIIVLEHSTFSWDSYDENNEDYHLAPNWSISAIGEKSINDSLFQADPTGNSRTVIGGMDMDMDGKKEVIATDYVGGRVIVYEMDMANNAFDVVWSSPVVEARNHAYNPRTVNVGDLDGDGKHEIVFPSSNVDAEGYHIYEWDGVEGSDNYGTLPSSICAVEVEICCGIDGAAFRGDHDRLTIFDIDGDGRQELITAIRRGSPRGALVVSLSPNDDLVHNSNGGLETWITEFQTNGNNHGGGSPLHALPADLNGDGNYEVVNHHWNNFNLYNFSATDTNTYVIADSGAADSYYKATYNDQYSMWGGYAFDVDDDGNDEAYYSSYGKQVGWSFVGTGDLYVVDYDTDEDVTSIGPDQVHLIGNAGQFAGDIGSGYDGHDNPYIFSSRGRPNITAMEYIGPDPSLGSSYLEKVIYWGELVVADTKTTTDETGAVTVKETKRWGFPSKVQTRWGDEMLDFDGDNKKEILMSFQNVQDSLTNTSYTWNATTAQYDTLVERVVSPKSWTFLMLENGSESLGIKDPITFIAPEDYRLEQNYPNPFNPNTMIRYTVPIDRKVSVKIYNVNGQLVNTLINNKLVSAGTHEVMWHGNNKNGLKVSTGMYFYSLEWAGMKKVKRMTLLK
jgi:hypothetical protein